jgi:tRNA(adenine34) deaminase
VAKEGRRRERQAHEAAMGRAIEVARAGAATGEQPYGAVVLAPDGRVVAGAHDEVVERHDATAHAELLAVQRAAAAHGPDLSGYTLISTVEPCAMCFQSAWWSRVDRLVYGLSMEELLEHVPSAFEEVVIDSPTLNDRAARRLEISPSVLKAECLELWGVTTPGTSSS